MVTHFRTSGASLAIWNHTVLPATQVNNTRKRAPR